MPLNAPTRNKCNIDVTFEKNRSALRNIDIINHDNAASWRATSSNDTTTNQNSTSTIITADHSKTRGAHLATSENASASKVTSHASFILLQSEDMRISKIMRRLLNENNGDTSLDLCKKLEIAVCNPANTVYVCRWFELLLDNMLSVMKKCPTQCLQQASHVLGLIGYINRSSFSIFKDFISKNFNSSPKHIQKHLIIALKTTFSFDAEKQELNVYSESVLLMLKDYLENAEEADIFISVSTAITEFASNYQSAFEVHFTDIVDIVIGWHLETDQPQLLKLHCAYIMQQFAPFFLQKLEFSFGLLGQFVEDIIGFGEQITSIAINQSDMKDANKQQIAETRIGSFIGAFNSMLKCLTLRSSFVGIATCESIVSHALNITMQIAKEMLNTYSPSYKDAIMNINELLCICFQNEFFNTIDMDQIVEIIDLQLKYFHDFNEEEKISCLYMILCIVRQMRTKLPTIIVTLIFESKMPHTSLLKLTNQEKVYKLLLRIYQEILLIKNVPLLQEAYKHLTIDIDECIACLSRSKSDQSADDLVTYYHSSQSETRLNFNISAVSALATQTSSIIGMYACNPSILELLITNCKLYDLRLWSKYPTSQFAILSLLIVHCQKNHNYRPTSRLLRENVACAISGENSSPTSENFTTILRFLACVLESASHMCALNIKLLLVWTQGLLLECRDRSELLSNNVFFMRICRAITSVMGATQIAPLECANCMEVLLLQYEKLSDDVYICCRDVALQQLDTLNPSLLNIYTAILGQLPLHVTLFINTNQKNDTNKERTQNYNQLMYHYRSSQYFSTLRDKFFKSFLNELQICTTSKRSVFSEYFRQSWIEQQDLHDQTQQQRCEEFAKCTRESWKMLCAWLQFEAARYCVQNKLRTSIGKPQETFLAIEAIIMKFASVTHGCKTLESAHNGVYSNNSSTSLTDLVITQQNMRMLLGFLDSLEQLIYNAAEGSAFAIYPSEKPARAFFRLNMPTCHAWFKRIRSGCSQIAMHCMEPEMVIRHTEQILIGKKTTDPIFEQSLAYMTWALLACGETDSLEGLYIWTRGRIGARYQWIQYAAEQSAGRKEIAAAGYLELLTSAEQFDKEVRTFIEAQLFECLYYTGQWSKLQEYKEHFLFRATNVSADEDYKRFALNSNTQLMCQLETIAKNSSYSTMHLNKALNDLTIWPSFFDSSGAAAAADTMFSERPNMNNINCSNSNNVLQKLEEICIDQTLTNGYMNLKLSMVEQEALDIGFQDSLYYVGISDYQRTDFMILKHVSEILKSRNNKTLVFSPNDASRSTSDNNKYLSSTILTKCLQWTMLLEQCSNHSMKSERKKHALYLDIAASARLEGNYLYCKTMLERFFASRNYTAPLLDIPLQLLNDPQFLLNINDNDLLRGYSEIAKSIHLQQDRSNEFDSINIGSSMCLKIHDQVTHFQQLHRQDPLQQNSIIYPVASADMLLTLADWLIQRGSGQNGNIAVTSSNALQQLLNVLPDVPLSDTSIIPTADKAVGKLINASILQRPFGEEAWCAFGNWCYRWGKKIVEARNANESRHCNNNLSQNEIQRIKEAIANDGDDCNENVIQQLLSTLNKHQLKMNDMAENDIEPHDETSSTELIEKDLRKIDLLADKSSSVIETIIQIWRQANRSIYSFYEMSAKSYFRYLSIKTANAEATPTAEQNQNQYRHHHVDDSTLVTITLRLLRLIAKHAIGLQEVLEDGLKTTPIHPWKVIIPQLFSRLNHHEPYVRKSVSDLLCRLAESRPQLVIFPAVVGANRELTNQHKMTHMVDNQQEQQCHQETLLDVGESSIALSYCFNSLLNTLSKQAPQTVAHVQLLVKELRRVSLLWDEYWSHSLAHLYTEYLPHIHAMEAESSKNQTAVQNDAKIITTNNKYDTLRKQLVNDFEKICRFTAKDPETKYERMFKDRFDTYITQSLENLRTLRLNEAWQKLKQLYNIFQQRPIRGTNATLKIADLSPILASMCNTTITMPGVDLFEKDPIHINSVDGTVIILPSKTKPKKLTFNGSNGQRYTYLFKGLEDLHLDERIMQFLSISNSIMASKNDTLTNWNKDCFKAHHYSVIPLGPQSGLISWVDGVTPLFAIYKRWQQRDAALKRQQKLRQNPTNDGSVNNQIDITEQAGAPMPAKRPSELFYGKLTPLLAKNNLKVSDPRKQWPLATLRQVLTELTNETPKDLLVKELWCNSVNAAEWRKSIRRYTISMAVMSVIGYVIGLGDRHLDNVLINLLTGEIVHIDYNVCFEKGKTLRIPEKVPFRLTPNLEEALGLTGIEGSFRLGCEYVLKVMRKERETLLTLLEAFVYDPLVDWTVGDDGTNPRRPTNTKAVTPVLNVNATSSVTTKQIQTILQHKKSEECDASIRQATFTKLNEVRYAWEQYKQQICAKLVELSDNLKALSDGGDVMQEAVTECENLTKQVALIREIESLGSALESHAFNSASERYGRHKRSTDVLKSLATKVKSDFYEVQNLMQIYFGFSLNRNRLTQLRKDILEINFKNSDHHQFAMHDLMQMQTSDQMFIGYDNARHELDTQLVTLKNVAFDCVDQLQQYAEIMQYYPQMKIRQKPYILFVQNYRQHLEQQEKLNAPTSLLVGGRHQQKDQQEQIEQLSESESTLIRTQYTEIMKSVWISISYDLHVATSFQIEHKRSPTPTDNPAIDDCISNLNRYLIAHNTIDDVVGDNQQHKKLSNAITQTLLKANDAFKTFENTALNINDPNWLDQQIGYVDVVLSLIDATAFENLHNCDMLQPANFQQKSAMLILQRTLDTLSKFKYFFQIDMSNIIFKLFLPLDNDNNINCLNNLCTMDGAAALKAYKLATGLLSAAGTGPNMQSSLPIIDVVDTIQQFFLAMEPAVAIFDELKNVLYKLIQTSQKIIKHLPDSSFKQLMLSKPSGFEYMNSFDFQMLFDIVKGMLLMAKSCDIRLFSIAINDFIDQIQRNILYGLTPLFVEKLCRAFNNDNESTIDSIENDVDTFNEIQRHKIKQIDICADAQLLCENLFIAFQQKSLIQQQQRHIELLERWLEVYVQAASAHNWANDETTPAHLSQTEFGHILRKDKLLNAIDKHIHLLNITVKNIKQLKSYIDECVINISKQKSNWNRNHVDSFVNFELSKKEQTESILDLIEKQLLAAAKVVYRFDGDVALTNCTDDDDNDDDDIDTIKMNVQQWNEAYATWQTSRATITPVEESLVQLLDPEGHLDKCWLKNINGLLDEIVFAIQRKINKSEHDNQTTQEQIKIAITDLQTLIDETSTLRADIRSLVNQILKCDKYNKQSDEAASSSIELTTSSTVNLRNAHRILKTFFNNVCELRHQLLLTRSNPTGTGCSTAPLQQRINELLLSVNQHDHNQVFRLLEEFILNESKAESTSSCTGAAPANNKTNNNFNQGEQKRNAYGVSVWKKIRIKLEGRDPDPNRRGTVAEQVDYIIRESLNKDNLAVLYEGWTPWV